MSDDPSPARLWRRECLRELLTARLDNKDLDNLAFDFDIDIGNRDKDEKIRTLLDYHFKRDNLAPLEKWILANRSDISLDGCRERRRLDPLPPAVIGSLTDQRSQRIRPTASMWSIDEISRTLLVGLVWLLVWLAGDRLGSFLDEAIRLWVESFGDGPPWASQLMTPLAWGIAGGLVGLLGGLGLAIGLDWSGARLSSRRVVALAGAWAGAWGIGFGLTSYLASQMPSFLNLLIGWLVAGMIGTWLTWRVLDGLIRQTSWSQLVLASGAWATGWLLYSMAVVLQLLPEEDIIRTRLFALGFAIAGMVMFMVFKKMLQAAGGQKPD